MTNIEAGDRRRATALVCHWGSSDVDGYNAVIAEAQEANRITPLIIEVVGLHSHIASLLLTRDGRACCTGAINRIASVESNGNTEADHCLDDCGRAARLVIAYDTRDLDGINSALRAAVETDRVNPLILSILSLYQSVVPQIYSEVGLSVLRKSVVGWAAREDEL